MYLNESHRENKIWFLKHYIDFYNSINKCDRTEVEYFNKIYSINRKEISSRVLNNWYKKGLIDDNRKNRKGWSKFSISEILWINIIQRLRTFGIDLNQIKKIKESLQNNNLIKNDTNFMILHFYMKIGLWDKIPIRLIVFLTGDSIISRQESIDKALQNREIPYDFISIDINSIVTENILNITNLTDYFSIKKDNLQEEINNSLREKETNSINIKVKENRYLLEQEIITKDRNKANKIHNLMKMSKYLEHKNGSDRRYSVKVTKRIEK